MSTSQPPADHRFDERIRRLRRPEELTSEEEQPWSAGRGTDVWEMLCASIRGDLERIRHLVNEDRRLASCSYQYRTPLHFAVQEGHVDVVRFLLDCGADATYRSGNFWHERATVIAQERGHGELIDLLNDHVSRTAGVDEQGERVAEAIRSRDVEAVRQLLADEPELLTAGDARGNQAIHWAVMIRSIEMLATILDLGGDINARRPDGARPLDLTHGDYYFRGWRDVPAEALSVHQVLIGYLIARGAEYDLPVAAKVGDTEHVRALLTSDPESVNAVPPYSTYYSGLPLRVACAANDLETVKTLLGFGADPNTAEPGIAPHGGALHAACGQGNKDMVQLLLERGADPNSEVESSGNCMSAARGHAQIVELLASHGGEFRDYDDLSRIPRETLRAVYGETLPLKYYVDAGDLETLASRFEADPEAVSAIIEYAVPDHPEVIKLCLAYDPSVVEQVRANAFVYALHRADDDTELTQTIDWLLEAGMSPNDSDWLRVSSLHRLAIGSMNHGSDGRQYRHHTKAMRLFIEAGADLDARDEEFQSTPLGWAARWGRPESVDLLLESGASVQLPDDPPWATPLAWARSKGHQQIEARLLAAGATA